MQRRETALIEDIKDKNEANYEKKAFQEKT